MLKKRLLRILLYILLAICLLVAVVIVFYHLEVRYRVPKPSSEQALSFKRTLADTNFYTCEKGWLNKSKTGLWELYLEGDPYQRGVANGLLTKELIQRQEKAFVDQLDKIIPSHAYQKFLKYFISYFNRNLDKYVPPEYQLEILGISRFASPQYRWIGPDYTRILNYHAAHDIGHAMQNMNLVGCTAFAAWGSKSADTSLIIGRNFDFYMGDEFSMEKIICFVHPDSGYNFMMITWGGMIGVVSGMNEKGLTITLNAAKSSIPYGAKTPVSIVAREILQYASSIEDAFSIAQKRETFVSEAFLVGSAHDGKAVIIEKSPENTAIYDPGTNYLVLTNHFQSDEFRNDPLNIENMDNGTSVYRYLRVEEILSQIPKIDPVIAASVLRDQKGIGGTDIGLGNEKSVNQLIAHHSVIFEPSKLLVWVAVPPYQLGPYVCYDLNKVFTEYRKREDKKELILDEKTIPADSFLYSQGFKDYQTFRKEEARLTSEPSTFQPGFEDAFISLNPGFYKAYSLTADYYRNSGDYEKAAKNYNLALLKEIASKYEEDQIKKHLEDCIDKTK